MAKLIVRNPQRAKLKTTGFIGQPEGDIILSENNKTTNVSSFATATVRVPEPTGTLLITENGEQIDIKDKEFVDVAVPEPSGTKEIVKNGKFDIKDYEFADVDVPLPSGEITLDKNNQSYNVTDYVTANVAIPEEEKTVTPSAIQQIVTPDNGLLNKVTVQSTPLEAKTVTPTSQQQVVTPTAPNIGLSSVTIGAAPQPTLITKQITENSTYAAEDDNADGFSDVTVAVPREITKLVDGTITVYIDNEATAIAPYAFYGRTALTTCIVPNARAIGNHAFHNTNALETVDFSNVETIGSYGFYGSLLNSGIIRFPNCTVVNEGAFRDMVYFQSNPRRAIFPKLINLTGNAFTSGTAWATISCLVFKQKVTLGTYNSDFFAIRNNANYAITKLYVPQRYFDWYTTATNWSAGYAAYPNVIRTIEDNVDYLVSLGFSREELLREDEVPT